MFLVEKKIPGWRVKLGDIISISTKSPKALSIVAFYNSADIHTMKWVNNHILHFINSHKFSSHLDHLSRTAISRNSRFKDLWLLEGLNFVNKNNDQVLCFIYVTVFKMI